jgi:hypothetical protein
MDTVIDGNLVTAAEWTGTPGMLREFALATGDEGIVSAR